MGETFSGLERIEIKKRDFKGSLKKECPWCERSIFAFDAEVAHIRPRGGNWKGSNALENGLCICRQCNLAMGSKHMLSFAKQYYPSKANKFQEDYKISMDEKENERLQREIQDMSIHKYPIYAKQQIYCNQFRENLEGTCAACEKEFSFFDLREMEACKDSRTNEYKLYCKNCKLKNNEPNLDIPTMKYLLHVKFEKEEDRNRIALLAKRIFFDNHFISFMAGIGCVILYKKYKDNVKNYKDIVKDFIFKS